MRFLTALSLIFYVLNFTGCVMFNKADFSGLFDEKVNVKFAGGTPGADQKIAIVPLHGTIVGTDTGLPFSRNQSITPRKVEMLLGALRQQKNLSAVVLEVNSPGGSAAASEEILSQLNEFKKQTGVPIVAYFLDMAASGGYYISQAADHIVANPNTLTGSIGVVVMFPQVDKFLKNKLDIEFVTFKSGRFKDSGSALRGMRKEEKVYWQKLTMQYYDRFVEIVAKGRKISGKQVKAISQGQVMHPQFALENNLIDEIGHLKDAIAKAQKLAKPSGQKQATEIFRISAKPENQPLIPQSFSVSTPIDRMMPAALSLTGPSGSRAGVWYIY